VASSVVTFFSSKENKELVKRLLKHVSFTQETVVKKNSSISKKVFVITGTLENFSRDSIKEKIISLGGIVSSSVSKKTDYVLFGENPGSKYDDGERLGITLISETEFLKMIQ
jgi:DNA ligase (NAD+)